MKIGLAVGTNDTQLIPLLLYLKMEKRLDYIELYVRTDTTLKELLKWQDTELVEILHAPHDQRAFTRDEDIELAQTASDFFDNIRGIVYDPGSLQDNVMYGDGIWPETMPSYTSFFDHTYSSLPKQNRFEKNFCLDVVHVWLTCQQLGLDYIKTLKQFIKQKPAHYHVGATSEFYADTHCLLEDSLVPLKEALALIPSKSTVTLEVDHEVPDRAEILENELDALHGMLDELLVK